MLRARRPIAAAAAKTAQLRGIGLNRSARVRQLTLCLNGISANRESLVSAADIN
jgi:hypothetical protein